MSNGAFSSPLIPEPPPRRDGRGRPQWHPVGFCAPGRTDRDLEQRGGICIEESFIDGTFVPAKRGPAVGRTERGKGTKIMAVVDRHGLPLAACTTSARPHEVTLVERTLDARWIDAQPQLLIVRHEYHIENYHAFLLRACAIILIRHF